MLVNFSMLPLTPCARISVVLVEHRYPWPSVFLRSSLLQASSSTACLTASLRSFGLACFTLSLISELCNPSINCSFARVSLTSHGAVGYARFVSLLILPGRGAQSVGHLTRKSWVLGSIPGLATYFRFSFRFFKKGSCQLLAKVCARSTDYPLRRSKLAQEKCGSVNGPSPHDLRCLPWT